MPKKFVYFARDCLTNLIKIGVTNDLDSRMNSFFTANPNLQLESYIEVDDEATRIEKFLHDVFIKKRDKGEYFDISREDAEEQIEFVKKWLLDRPDSNEIEKVRNLTDLDPVREPTNIEREIIDRLVDIRAEKARLELQEEVLRDHLIKSVGSSSGIKGWINFRSKSETRLDMSRFKNERPELYEEYSRTINVRVFLMRPNIKN